MVYKWYILPIGGLYATYHLLGEPETTIEKDGEAILELRKKHEIPADDYVATPLKTNMTMENHGFLIGDASSFMVAFLLSFVSFRG